MIPNSVIKADFTSFLKAHAVLTALLASNKEVRENQYQGTVFAYPAVRVGLTQQIHLPDTGPCDLARLTFSIRSYAEGASSKPADDIAGVVNGILHRHFFQGTGWTCAMFRSSGLAAAVRTSEKLWRAEDFFQGVIYPM